METQIKNIVDVHESGTDDVSPNVVAEAVGKVVDDELNVSGIAEVRA